MKCGPKFCTKKANDCKKSIWNFKCFVVKSVYTRCFIQFFDLHNPRMIVEAQNILAFRWQMFTDSDSSSVLDRI